MQSKRWGEIFYGCLIGLCAFLLVACATNGQKEQAPVPLPSIQPKVNLQQSWKHATDIVYPGPKAWVLDNDRLYVAESDGRLTVLDIETGHPIARIETGLANLVTLSVDGADLVLADNNGLIAVFRLDEQFSTANLLWKKELTSKVMAHPVLAGGKMYVRTLDGKVYALDRGEGRIQWTREKTVPTLTLNGVSDPLVDQDKLIVGFDDGELEALDLATGQLVWKATVALPKGRNVVDRLVDIDGTPQIRQGVIYVSAYQIRSMAVASESGHILWELPYGSYQDSLILDDSWVIITKDSQILVVDREQGIKESLMQSLLYRKLTAPVAYQGFVAVGDNEGYVHLIDIGSKTLAGRLHLGKNPVVALLANQDHLFAMDKKGQIFSCAVKSSQ
ncbi:MAG: hypothetical protein D6698_01385 [Gammaproteobacteria bacterium]|nr:MAG: hypothetical protein D6698_01385 [Gammaproteobacteria bacterium]